MSKLLFSLLVATVAMFVLGGVEAQAQTPLQLKTNGFVTGQSKDVIFTPGPTVPYADVFVPEATAITFPVRQKGEGPQLAPTRVFVDGKEWNPASAGVFPMPSPLAQHIRLYFVPALMPADVQGPGLGRADLEGVYGEDGSYLSQLYVPQFNGWYVTYPQVLFSTPAARTAFMATDRWTKFVETRDRLKAEFEAKAKKAEKKDEDKEEKKDDEKKEEGDKPEADDAKSDDPNAAPAAEEPKQE
jgi:hypothetical protein